MIKIKNIEKIRNLYPDWKVSDIAFIESLEWSINDVVIVFYCQLRNQGFNWPDLSKDFFQISIKFNNISNFKLDFNCRGLQQISGFDIIDISNNGSEHINYQIEDYENGIINFYCEQIEILDVFPSAKIDLNYKKISDN